MLNCILFAVLMAGIGSCYVWLGARKKDRADQVLNLHREIETLKKQIKERDLQLSRRLTPEDLRARLERTGLDLKPIDIGPKGRLVRLPDPTLTAATFPHVPALADSQP
jgi:hypothetical protein